MPYRQTLNLRVPGSIPGRLTTFPNKSRWSSLPPASLKPKVRAKSDHVTLTSIATMRSRRVSRAL